MKIFELIFTQSKTYTCSEISPFYGLSYDSIRTKKFLVTSTLNIAKNNLRNTLCKF